MGYTDAPDDWWKRFILESDPPPTGKLAVVRADGSPHVAPVWVDVDGDDVVFMTAADTLKGKAILRDPRVALCFDDERPPFSFVTHPGDGDHQHRPERPAPLGHPRRRAATWAPTRPRPTAGATPSLPRWSCE